MPTEAGYSNTKKQGRPAWKTLHPLGSSRVGQHVVTKSLVERQAIPVAITAVTQNTTDTLIRIELAGHGALVGDIARFYTGALQGAELEIVSVVDANNFVVRNLVGVPAIADTIKVMYYVTPKSDAEGNVNFSPGPTTFSQDGVVVTVAEDTVDPSNNKGLPVNLVYYRDGVPVTVNIDTATPALNRPLPVELANVTGTVTINAGDLNVSTNSTNDSMAIGDAVTGDKANVRLNDDATLLALKVKDDDANTKLAAIQTATGLGATEATLSTRASEATLDLVRMAADSIAAEDFATLTEQQAQTALLGTIDADTSALSSTVNTDGNPVGTTGIILGGKDDAGDFQQLKTNTDGDLRVTFGTAGFATETTLAALNNKVANDYGASLGAIRTAAQLGNTTGQADFGVGADTSQTLRVSANLKRAGNELSYNSGAADANTLRSVLATRHEAAATPLANRLSDGSTFIGTASLVGTAQKTVNTSATTLKVAAFALGFDSVNSLHREILVDGTGRVSVTQSKVMSSQANFTAAGDLAPPAGAKGFVIQNSSRALGALRFAAGAGVASSSVGFLLEPGQSTSYQDGAPSVLSIGNVDSATLDGCVIWYV